MSSSAQDHELSLLDQRLAAFFAGDHPALAQIVISLSQALAQGHSCIQLNTEQQAVIKQVDCDAWVLEQDLLYFARYYHYETRLAAHLRTMAVSEQSLEQDIALLFDDAHQRQAAELALSKRLALITGGPGTGKTTTVVNILALLIQQQPNVTLALSAPTGKAAMRLQESIANSAARLEGRYTPEVIAAIPHKVTTLHRLLGARPFSPNFKHHAQYPLSHDVVVVDEASMIDLALMSKLVDALKPSAKLILLGDKDQLASVESGAVLADCYQALQANRVELQTTYRFNHAIKNLAQAVNAQDVAGVMDALQAEGEALSWYEMAHHQQLKALVYEHYQPYFSRLQQIESEQDIRELFDCFNAFKLLVVTRQGEFGLENMNALCEQALQATQKWYVGRAIMIEQNDPATGLYNGDIGLCLPDINELDNPQRLKVYFLLGQELRSFIPTRLPPHQSAFAMTIHKSQGSEFDHVMLVLGQQVSAKTESLMTKELLYTAITRARSKVTIIAGRQVLASCVQRAIERHSGLANKLTQKKDEVLHKL